MTDTEEAAIERLADRLRLDTPWAREAAAAAIAGLGGPAAEAALREALAAADEWTRRAALVGLVALREDEALTLLERGLRDPSAVVRHAAVQGAAEFGPGAVEQLTWLLSDPDGDVRREVARCMTELGAGELVVLTQEALAGQAGALQALADRGLPGPLAAALQGRHATTRIAAARALAELHDQHSLPPLDACAASVGALARNSDRDVRAACLAAAAAIRRHLRREATSITPAEPPEGTGEEGLPAEPGHHQEGLRVPGG